MTSWSVRTPCALYKLSHYYSFHKQIQNTHLRMNTFKPTEQIFWANNLHVDKVVPWEIENLCNLLNAIFSEAVGHEVDKLRQEKCCGCEVNHPRQRRHECLMMSEEEGWIMHGLEAIERIIKHEIVW